jgi:hypothetical protein
VSGIHYHHVMDGDTVYPVRRGYRMMCCDCGLVHKINFRLVPHGKRGKRIVLTVYRDERATAAARRRKQVKT